MAQVEIFSPNGVIAGVTPLMPLVADGPTLEGPLSLEEARWYPLDGSPASVVGSVTVGPDDILIVVTPEPEVRTHANWHAIVLEVGPYRVSGQLATQPGFDPGRAITRPGGSFVPLTDAVIELRDRRDATPAERAHVEVNRYAVDSVTSPIMLGFFFPGAQLIATEGAPVA